MLMPKHPAAFLGPAVSRHRSAPAPAGGDSFKLPPFVAPRAFPRSAAAAESPHLDELDAVSQLAEPDTRGAAAIADQLERLARALRSATPADLAAMGRNTTDPLELLILGFVLGYTSRSSLPEV